MEQLFNVDKEMAWYRDRPYRATPNNYVKKDTTGRAPNKKPKPVDQYDRSGETIIASHNSVAEAAQALFISKALIYNMLIGNADHAKGFVFKYKETVNELSKVDG